MSFRNWLEGWCIDILRDSEEYSINVYDKKSEKSERVESPAYKRLYKLITTLRDLSPTVKEIKKIDDNGGKIILSIETSMETRWIGMDYWEINFYDKQPKIVESKYHPTYSTWYKFDGDYLYSVKICTEYKSVNVCPRLTTGAPMTEEEIYNSVTEIESILDKYSFIKSSEEHKANLKKFIGRFDA